MSKVVAKSPYMTQVGFTCGSFDLLHAGHIMMLKEASEQCKSLIVGLQTDPSLDRKEKNKPVQSLEERYIQLEAVKYVDSIVIYETEEDLYNLLKKIKPDIRIIGNDHKGKEFTGHDLDIKCYFNTRNHSFSSSELRRRIYLLEREKWMGTPP